jgi:hypothetical protein
MSRLVGICRDALGPSDINKGAIAGSVSFSRYSTDICQFGGWIDKAFVATGDIVVGLDPEDVILFGITDNLSGILFP